MNYLQLKSFVMAYETHNLMRCSENLFISQSAISQQIKRLEEELGTELFVHRKGAIISTASGDTFYPYAKQSIEAIMNGQQALLNLSKDTPIDIYCFFYNGRSLMSEIVSEFKAQHPNVSINLRTKQPPVNGIMQEEIKQNSLYFAEPSWTDKIGMHFYRLYSSHCVCVMREDNPLAEKTVLCAEDILNQIVYMPEKNYPYMTEIKYPSTQSIMSELREKLSPDNNRKSGSFLESLFNVNVSGGVFICPDYLFAPTEKLAAVPYRPDIRRDVGFAYVGNLSPAMKLFLEYLKRRFVANGLE